MTPGFAGFRSTKNPIFHIPESDTMTKRDSQASAYAAESYEKPPAERCVSHMSWALTDEERAALHWFAHYGLPEHRAATLRSLLERLS
jgi:hypothetical protein